MDLNNEQNYFLISGNNLSLMIFNDEISISLILPISIDPIYYSV
jgi:hypothetical protein